MAIEIAKTCQTVIACDLTMMSLQRLKNNLEKLKITNVVLCCCSADNLPFKSGLFDSCCMNAVIEHVPKEDRAIAELARMIKANGLLMMVAPLKYQFLNPLLLPINMIHDRLIGHLRRYDDKSIRKKFSTNFQLETIWYTGHTTKVIQTIVNMIKLVFNERQIESDDKKKEHKKWWASNICWQMKRK